MFLLIDVAVDHRRRPEERGGWETERGVACVFGLLKVIILFVFYSCCWLVCSKNVGIVCTFIFGLPKRALLFIFGLPKILKAPFFMGFVVFSLHISKHCLAVICVQVYYLNIPPHPKKHSSGPVCLQFFMHSFIDQCMNYISICNTTAHQ